MPEDVSTAIGLGANLGSAVHIIAQAVRHLADGGLSELTVAPFYRTAPLDCEAHTPPFFNSALTARWRGTAETLLDLCQAVEQRLGRPATHSSREARIIDIDILLIDARQIDRPGLTVPHPRLRQRLFALAPLADIAPHWPIPPDMNAVAVHRDRLLNSAAGKNWGEKITLPPRTRQALRKLGNIVA